MKTIRINLQELLKPQMNGLRGGNVCNCSCYYALSGGSSTEDNSAANYEVGSGGVMCNCSCYYALNGGSSTEDSSAANFVL